MLNRLAEDNSDHHRALVAELAQFGKFDSLPRSELVAKLGERVEWLTNKASKPDADFRLGYLLAGYVWKLGDVRNAALLVAMADLRSFGDLLYCKDKTSPPQRLAGFRATVKPIYDAVRNGPNELKADVRLVVENGEALASLRGPSVWMCSGGSQQLVKIMNKYPEIAALETSKPIPQPILDKYPGVITVSPGNVMLSDNSILPDFYSADEWKKRLSQLFPAHRKSYLSALGIE